MWGASPARLLKQCLLQSMTLGSMSICRLQACELLDRVGEVRRLKALFGKKSLTPITGEHPTICILRLQWQRKML